MSRLSRLTLGSAVLLAAAALIFGAVRHKQPTDSLVSHVDLTAKPRYELITTKQDEWMNQQTVGPDGKVTETFTQFRTGETGRRVYSKDRKLESEIIWRVNGKPRKEFHYAADGISVVNGYEYRSDGIMLVKVQTVNNAAITTTFWHDGAVFSVDKRELNNSEIDVSYFYRNGKPSLHYVGSVPAAHQRGSLMWMARELQAWNEDGNLTAQTVRDDRGVIFNVYGPNGKLLVRHTWETRPAFTYGPSFRLARISKFADDGVRVAREIVMGSNSGYPERFVDTAEDKTLTVTFFVPWSDRIRTITRYNAEGVQLSTEDPVNMTFKLDENEVKAPVVADPLVEWTAQEAKFAPRPTVVVP